MMTSNTSMDTEHEKMSIESESDVITRTPILNTNVDNEIMNNSTIFGIVPSVIPSVSQSKITNIDINTSDNLNYEESAANVEGQQVAIHTELQMQQSETHDQIVSTIGEYFTSRIVIKTNETNNFYFKRFAESNAIKYHKIVTSKLYSFVAFGVCCILALIGEIIFKSSDQSQFDAGHACYIVAGMITFCYSLSLLASVNLKIMYLIVNTFDFWIKIINIITAQMAFIVLEIVQSRSGVLPWLSNIVALCAEICVVLVCFIDGLNIPFIVKKYISVLSAVLIGYVGIYTFFFTPDFIWNPFESFRYTQVSFKSVYLSCLINLCVFMLKPFFSKLMRGLRRKLCSIGALSPGTKYIGDNVSTYQRCSSVYKRPFLQWVQKQ